MDSAAWTTRNKTTYDAIFAIKLVPIKPYDLRFDATNNICLICQQLLFMPGANQEVVSLIPCGHLFHRVCTEMHARNPASTCPVCLINIVPAANEVDLTLMWTLQEIKYAREYFHELDYFGKQSHLEGSGVSGVFVRDLGKARQHAEEEIVRVTHARAEAARHQRADEDGWSESDSEGPLQPGPGNRTRTNLGGLLQGGEGVGARAAEGGDGNDVKQEENEVKVEEGGVKEEPSGIKEEENAVKKKRSR